MEHSSIHSRVSSWNDLPSPLWNFKNRQVDDESGGGTCHSNTWFVGKTSHQLMSSPH